jgi:hypothetical protein
MVTVVPVAHPGINIQATGAGATTRKINFTITITVPNGLNIQRVTIDYGDNTGTFDLGGAPNGTITGISHTYATTTDKTVTVTVFDSAGGQTTATTIVTPP